MDRVINYISRYKNRILGRDSKFFKKLFETVTTTHSIGDKNEIFASDLLSKLFGGKNVKIIGELGSEKDMGGGIDVEITHNNNLFTGQIKPVSSIHKIDDNYEIKISSGVKKYNTDWMIFIENRKKIYVFKTSKINIVDDKYVVPSKYLLFTME